jgi:pimeloyl-ACP methyl ester carboxylesterase
VGGVASLSPGKHAVRALQTRSEVDVGAADSHCSAVHWAWATQGVAGSASSSKVPGAHASDGDPAAPPVAGAPAPASPPVPSPPSAPAAPPTSLPPLSPTAPPQPPRGASPAPPEIPPVEPPGSPRPTLPPQATRSPTTRTAATRQEDTQTRLPRSRDGRHEGALRPRASACPTLIVAGRRDLCFPPDVTAAHADRIPGSRYLVLDAPHVIWGEAACELNRRAHRLGVLAQRIATATAGSEPRRA